MTKERDHADSSTKNELWFVVVANPDGYDYTFTPGNRLWRKNLRDNNDDGQITADVDGVDPNRNFPTKWNYDDEGSSTDPASETYRGTGAGAPSPRRRRCDGLLEARRLRDPDQLPHGRASCCSTRTASRSRPTPPTTRSTAPSRARTPTRRSRATAPGAPNDYDPDVGAELYTTNGETTDHAHGTLRHARVDAGARRRRPRRAGGGGSVFEFQDREADLEAAFEKNIPFALDVAQVGRGPREPGLAPRQRAAPDFEVSPFDVSYGDPQHVQVNAKRELGTVTMHYRVNGGAEQTAPTEGVEGRRALRRRLRRLLPPPARRR